MSIIAQSIARIGINYGQQPVARIGLFGQTQQDGKSGYWRLFFYNMQEEALRARSEVAESKVAEVAVKPARKVKKRVVKPVSVEPEIEAIPFTPLAQFKRLDDQPNYVQEAWAITLELRNLVTQHKNLTVQYRNEINVANDEEDDIELLLLVA